MEHRGYVEGKEFTDVAVKSPFAEWRHVHRVSADGVSGSVLTDEVSYRLPGGAAGRMLAQRMTETSLERLFAFRRSRMTDDLRFAAVHGAVRPMRIAMTGSSGLVGSALEVFLRSQGHEVVRLVRSKARHPSEVFWNPSAGELDTQALKTVDAVVHLAGANVAGGRWTRARRAAIWDSRVNGTRTLVSAMSHMRHRPFVFVSASGTGIYGNRGDEELCEESERGPGFLADVCDAWEAEANAVAEFGIRPVMLRTGMVLSPAGGALARLLPVFRAGLGGKVGSGEQWVSWISIDDLVAAYYLAILDQRLVHQVNAVSPEPVRNAEFTQTLARVLRRPAALPVPAVALRLGLGQMADELLLASAKVVPQKLFDSRYRFRHEHLEDALRFVLGRV